LGYSISVSGSKIWRTAYELLAMVTGNAGSNRDRITNIECGTLGISNLAEHLASASLATVGDD
jgi:endonuclease IV